MQLAHAMLACGYDLVVPVSWGEEALAEYTLRTLDTRGGMPVVHCACPALRERLLASGDELAPFLLTLVAPVVATARYLRALHADVPMHVTVIGGCPGSRDASIDSRIGAHDFLQLLASRGISLERMPAVFDSVIPPDRRRYYSLPGGCPSPKALESRAPERRLVTITEDGFSTELAEHLLGRESVLIDLSPRLACACCGGSATRGASVPGGGRDLILRHEPPRAPTPILDHDLELRLEISVSEAREGSAASEQSEASAGSQRTRGARERTSERGGRADRLDHFRLPGAQPIGTARTRPERPRIAVTPAGVAEIPSSGRPAPPASIRVPTASPPAARPGVPSSAASPAISAEKGPVAPPMTAAALPAATAATAATSRVAGSATPAAGESAGLHRGASTDEGSERAVFRTVERADARRGDFTPALAQTPSPASPTAVPHQPPTPPAPSHQPSPPTQPGAMSAVAKGAPPGETSLAARGISTWTTPARAVTHEASSAAIPGLTASDAHDPGWHSRSTVAAASTRRRFSLGRGTGHPRLHASDGKVLPRAYARHTPPGMRAVEDSAVASATDAAASDLEVQTVVVDERAAVERVVVESVEVESVEVESVVAESAEEGGAETEDADAHDASGRVAPGPALELSAIASVEEERTQRPPLEEAAGLEGPGRPIGQVAELQPTADERTPAVTSGTAAATTAREPSRLGDLALVVSTPESTTARAAHLSRARDALLRQPREVHQRQEGREPRSLAFFIATAVLVVAIVVALAVIFRRPPTAP